VCALVIQHPAFASAQAPSKKTEMPIGDSKFLQLVTYDPQNFQMTVTMKNGAQYLYFMVYPQVMSNFMEAKDKSRFYANEVRGKHQSARTISKSIGKKISTTRKTQGRPNG